MFFLNCCKPVVDHSASMVIQDMKHEGSEGTSENEAASGGDETEETEVSSIASGPSEEADASANRLSSDELKYSEFIDFKLSLKAIRIDAKEGDESIESVSDASFLEPGEPDEPGIDLPRSVHQSLGIPQPADIGEPVEDIDIFTAEFLRGHEGEEGYDLSPRDRKIWKAMKALVILSGQCFKGLNKSPDAFSHIEKWLVEADYALWGGNQGLRGFLCVKGNSSVPGTDSYTIGPESLDATGCASIFSFIFSIIDSRSSYVNFDNARVDLKNSEGRMAEYLVAKEVADFTSGLIEDIKSNTIFKKQPLPEGLRNILLRDLQSVRASATRKADQALDNAGSTSDKRMTFYSKIFGVTRDVIVQPLQGLTNVTLFSLKAAVLDMTAAVKSFFKLVISALAKLGSVFGMLAGLFQGVQGAFETSGANKKSKRISAEKECNRTAIGNMRLTRTEEPNFVDELGERIVLHNETGRKIMRQTNRWDRAIGVVRIIYGVLLGVAGLLSLAVPFVAPVMALVVLALTSAFIGWTSIRCTVMRHRRNRLEKENSRIRNGFDAIMKHVKPKMEAEEKDMAKVDVAGANRIVNGFWRNEKYLKNRLFALEAAKHYLTTAHDYQSAQVDCNGLTEKDRARLKLFLTEMGVPAESFDNCDADALSSAFKNHLIGEAAIRPTSESQVQQAIQMLGKDDHESRRLGMNTLENRVGMVVRSKVTETDKGEAAIRKIEKECHAAIEKAFRARTRKQKEAAAQELQNLFAVPKPRARFAGSWRSIELPEPGLIDSEDDEILVPPTEPDDIINILSEGSDGGKAARVLFNKLRGYSVERLMHNLKCYSGSVFATGERSTQFDKVSSKVARIALAERLRFSPNKELHDPVIRNRIVQFCAYAAEQEGMVGYGLFNHKVHPDFGRLASVIDIALKRKEEMGAKWPQWLVMAIGDWPEAEPDRQKFWSSMKVALLSQESNQVGTRLVKALKSDPVTAVTALNWLSHKKLESEEALRLIACWKMNVVNKAEEVAQHIEYKLGIRKYVDTKFDWLALTNETTNLKSRVEVLSDMFVKGRTADEAISAFVDLLAEAPVQREGLDTLVKKIVEENYPDDPNADGVRGAELIRSRASAAVALTMRFDFYCEVLAAWRQGVKHVGKWWMPKFAEEWIVQRVAVNRNFVVDDLAVFLGKPHLRGNHPMSPDIESSLGKLGKKNPGEADKFLRGHYSFEDTDQDTDTDTDTRANTSVDTRSESKNGVEEENFTSLLQTATKVSKWGENRPSFDGLYQCLASATSNERRPAIYYLRQNRLSAEAEKKMVGAAAKKDREAFDTALYEFLSRGQQRRRGYEKIDGTSPDSPDSNSTLLELIETV